MIAKAFQTLRPVSLCSTRWPDFFLRCYSFKVNHRDAELAIFHFVPRSFSARMLISAVLLLSVASAVIVGIAASGDLRVDNVHVTHALLWISGVVLAAVGLAAWIARMQPAHLPALQLDDTGITGPLSTINSKLFSCRYEDVVGVAVQHRGPWRRRVLFIDTLAGSYLFAAKDFTSPEAPTCFRKELKRRTRMRPGGAELWRSVVARNLLARRLSAATPVATYALLAMLVLISLCTLLPAATIPSQTALNWGANAGLLALHGQPYRLVTANFLHSGWVHLLLNGAWLLLLGRMLERLLGTAGFMVLAFASGVVGHLGSALVGALFPYFLFSIGASAIVYGLLGSVAMLNFRFGAALPAGLRWPRHYWIGFAFAYMVPALLVQESVDHVAHAIGLLAGAGTTAVLLVRQHSVEQLMVARRDLSGASIAVMVLVLASAATAGYRVAAGAVDADAATLRTLIEHHPRPFAETDNAIAWSTATDPASPVDALEAALQLGLRAMAQARDTRDSAALASYTDTVATLHYRRGDLASAVQLEESIVTPKDVFRQGQRARFLESYYRSSGLWPPDPSLQPPVLAAFSATADAYRMTISMPGAYPRGIRLALLVYHQDKLAGLIEARIGQTTQAMVELSGDARAMGLHDLSAIIVKLVEADSTACGCAAGSLRSQAWPYLPAVARLP